MAQRLVAAFTDLASPRSLAAADLGAPCLANFQPALVDAQDAEDGAPHRTAG
jgi:hypothetical protein